jgi:hypothetical protein
MRRVVVLASVAVTVLGCHVVLAEELSADPTGNARETALADLRLLPGHVRPLGLEDASVLATASLGDPFVCYWPDTTFLEYEKAPPNDLLHYVRKYDIRFPVIVDGRVLGSINVIPIESGAYRVGSRSIGSEQTTRREAVLQLFEIPAGRRLSILGTGGVAGTFFVIEDGTRIYEMAPIEGRPSHGETPSFRSVDQFAGRIKTQIGIHRKRVHDEPARRDH